MPGMKEKTVKTILRKKITNWISSLPEDLQERARMDTIVCGGAITSLLQGERPNDYDIYFRTYETALAIAKHYVDKYNALHPNTGSYKPEVQEQVRKNIKGVEEKRIVIFIRSAGAVGANPEQAQYFEMAPPEATDTYFSEIDSTEGLVEEMSKDPIETASKIIEQSRPKDWRPLFLTDNALTLSNQIQIITRFHGNPDKIHENFDFDHCKCSYDHAAQRLDIPLSVYQSVMSKTLIYTGSLYPLTSLFRIRKFIKRGWRISAGQMLKIVIQMRDINWSNREVLREQLLGVDTAYMTQFVNAIANEDPDKVDGTYLTNLVDTIFED